MSLAQKGSPRTLAGALVDAGAATAEQFQALGIPLDQESPGVLPERPATLEEYDDATAVSIQLVADLVNQARAEEGLPPLILDPQVTVCAMIRAEELHERFAHSRPDGSANTTVLYENGVTYMRCGENIASGYPTPTSVVNGWLDSSGHRKNIMNKNYTRLGVGVSGKRWVQIFID